jgi:hypothetical protein
MEGEGDPPSKRLPLINLVRECSLNAKEIGLKITDIQTFVVSAPMRGPLKWSAGVRRGVPSLIVRILTDDGIEGIGEFPGPY